MEIKENLNKRFDQFSSKSCLSNLPYSTLIFEHSSHLSIADSIQALASSLQLKQFFNSTAFSLKQLARLAKSLNSLV